MSKLLILIKNHRLAISFAILTGVIYLAPHIFFIASMGEKYQGIPMMQTANENFYLARMQEILDGHPALGSFVYYEYKGQWPLSPPTGEFFYALPALLFNVSPANIVIISRFVLLAILFLLVYALISGLTVSSFSFANKFNAIAGALWVTLGYDLIDFRSLWNFLAGKQDILAGGFLVWSRPVNPILGAIFLFSFLLLLLALWQKTKYRKTGIIFAGLFLALMMASYFFSWGMALSVWGVLIVIALAKKELPVVKSFFWVLLTALFFASPYWYMSWQAGRSPWYADSVLRSGLFYTHYPLLNKLMLLVLVFYLVLTVWSFFIKNRPFNFSLSYLRKFFDSFEVWHWFCLSFILGALWAYSQQVITGVTIWPYHFVQYSIPLAIIAVMVLLFNIIKAKAVYFWSAAAGLIVISSLAYGIYVQASVYEKSFSYYADIQSYAKIFNWLNQQPKDCVVLVKPGAEEAAEIDKLIHALTHCNNFISNEGSFSLLPQDRLIFNYLVFLRLNNVKPENIESYLAENKSEARSRLFSNWQGLYGVKDFPDFSDPLLEERIKKFPQDYREFYTKDFRQVLSKYRLDYILSVGPLTKNSLVELPGLKEVWNSGNIFIYKF